MKRFFATLVILANGLFAGEYPWSNAAPVEVIQASVTPNQVLDEVPCNWRPVLTPIVDSMVTGCRTAKEAVLTISSQLSKKTGVFYSPERSKHNMNVLEALAEKKVSCTGQSILLVCALRAIDIPARAVGIRTWNHIRGNHTWAEAWFEGEWHMIEFNERDFNTPWVIENVGMLNTSNPNQRILAATPEGKRIWGMSSFACPVLAEDVTERYTRIARSWYQNNGLSDQHQRLLLDIVPRIEHGYPVELLDENHSIVAHSILPSKQDDMRYMTSFHLPRQGLFFLRVNGSNRVIPISATDQPVRIIRLSHLQIPSES